MARTEQQSTKNTAGAGFGATPRPPRSFRSLAASKRCAGCWQLCFPPSASTSAFRGADRCAAGEVYRVIFIHVPAAWMAMVIYLAMAFWSLLGLVLGTRLSFMMSHALAPTGAIMAVISLWTGAPLGPTHLGHLLGGDARSPQR